MHHEAAQLLLGKSAAKSQSDEFQLRGVKYVWRDDTKWQAQLPFLMEGQGANSMGIASMQVVSINSVLPAIVKIKVCFRTKAHVCIAGNWLVAETLNSAHFVYARVFSKV